MYTYLEAYTKVEECNLSIGSVVNPGGQCHCVCKLGHYIHCFIWDFFASKRLEATEMKFNGYNMLEAISIAVSEPQKLHCRERPDS